jgi:hypothetical protein
METKKANSKLVCQTKLLKNKRQLAEQELDTNKFYNFALTAIYSTIGILSAVIITLVMYYLS